MGCTDQPPRIWLSTPCAPERNCRPFPSGSSYTPLPMKLKGRSSDDIKWVGWASVGFSFLVASMNFDQVKLPCSVRPCEIRFSARTSRAWYQENPEL